MTSENPAQPAHYHGAGWSDFSAACIDGRHDECKSVGQDDSRPCLCAHHGTAAAHVETLTAAVDGMRAELADRAAAPLFAAGLELDDETRGEIETAAELVAATAELYEITEQAATLARQEFAEARAKVDAADEAHARSGRACDMANSRLVGQLRAAGLVRTADGITTPGAAAVAESSRRAAEAFDQARALARDGISPL